MEDCLHSNQRSKFEDFGNHQLLVWFVYVQGDIYEFEFVIFPKLVLIVSNAAAPHGQSWKSYLGITGQHTDPWMLLYQALDRGVELSETSINPLFKAIGEFEDLVLKQSSANLETLIRLKLQLGQAEFALSSLASVVGQWQEFLKPKDQLQWKMRDLWDHCTRLHQALIFHRQQISSSMDMYWGFTAMRTNEQVKKLSTIATIFLPLAFWTSFWGMNFEAIPFREPWLLGLALSVMPISISLIYFLFKKKGLL